MILFLIKLVVGALLATTLVCELSDKFKDGFIHYTIRYALMIVCILILFKVQLLFALPVIAQAVLLGFCTISCLLIYKHILLNQLSICKYVSDIKQKHQHYHSDMQIH